MDYTLNIVLSSESATKLTESQISDALTSALEDSDLQLADIELLDTEE